MANSIDKYFTEILMTITDYNECNDTPLFNDKILEAIHKVIAEEELDSHNLTVDNFRHTSNTQR